MRSFAAAVGLFSVLPVRGLDDVDRGHARGAMLAFPWLGALLGAIAGAVGGVAAWQQVPLLGPVLALATLAALTGALHLDGVADTADGLGSRKPAAEALSIMRRSDIGPMGVVTLVFVLGIQAMALASVPGPAWVPFAALTAAAMVSRLTVTVATVGNRFARDSGFGALFRAVTPRAGAIVDALLVAGALAGLGLLAAGPRGALVFAVAAAVAALVAWGWGAHLLRRLGGWTGDTFGSLIEITATVFLVGVALGL